MKDITVASLFKRQTHWSKVLNLIFSQLKLDIHICPSMASVHVLIKSYLGSLWVFWFLHKNGSRWTNLQTFFKATPET